MTESVSLHDLLLRDWGIDLPIDGGWGQSRNDPIVVTADDAIAVATVQFMTLRGLGRGRGVFWRTVGLRWDNEASAIQQFKIETTQLTESEIINQVENYYFDLSRLKTAGSGPLESPPIVYHDRSGLLFPYEIDRLHFDIMVDNERHGAGSDVTIHFKAPQTVASVYVYGNSQVSAREIRHPEILAEFENASAELLRIHPDFAPWPDPQMSDRLIRYYRVGEGRAASLLALTIGRNRFVKVRVTWLRDEFIDKVATTFVDNVIAIAGSAHAEPRH